MTDAGGAAAGIAGVGAPGAPAALPAPMPDPPNAADLAHATTPTGATAERLPALARAALRGSAGAHDDLAAALYPDVRGVLAGRLRRCARDDLEDLTQAAMGQIARRLEQCRADSDRALRAWARAVAWHVALDTLRSDRASPTRHTLPSPSQAEAALQDVALAQWRAEQGAELWPDARERRRVRLARAAVCALDGLPQATGLLFWLRVMEGAAWQEVAAVLGTTPGGAKRRFQRAVATLRRRVGGW